MTALFIRGGKEKAVCANQTFRWPKSAFYLRQTFCSLDALAPSI
jgi:hypothetical protein